MSTTNSTHQWRFFRSGGFDQVTIATPADLQHLSQLDPKLWTVLNCPTTGLEFDETTLAMMDLDADGQIRVPEILAAVDWCCARLADLNVMFAEPGLPLAAIFSEDELGAGIKHAAEQVLVYSNKTPQDNLQVSDLLDNTRLFAADHFNGDGIVTAELTPDPELKQFMAEIILTQGSVVDRSGSEGVDAETLQQFITQAQNVLDWHAMFNERQGALCPLAEQTADAVAAFEAVQAKIDDYFVRCQLAAFDDRATINLNPATAVYDTLANKVVVCADSDIAALPLSAIAADKALVLNHGINPAWAESIKTFSEKVLTPLLGKPCAELTYSSWQHISAQLAAWRNWMAARPDTAVHDLGLERLQFIITNALTEKVHALIAQDLHACTFADNLKALEKLVRFQRDLVTLLRNYVCFSDFYQDKQKAIFQAGTLYIDQRSCELVMQVADINRHAAMAPFSGCFLVYCTCTRNGEAPLNIVAALTGGDVDDLMVAGRNGVFYDRKGQDWKASVTKVVAQPVSIRQAFWSPYRRVAAFIESQVQKFAASRDKDIETNTTVATPTPSSFDIAKFAGIFAAFGLAIGALGTALAAVVSGLFQLSWWQIPLVLITVLVIISTPSMIMAYLTLRRRNLGPLLDANGWAVNTRAKINVPFGAALTGVAHLPKGSTKTLRDPFAEKQSVWPYLLIMLLVILAGWGLWQRFFATASML